VLRNLLVCRQAIDILDAKAFRDLFIDIHAILSAYVLFLKN
jgi:hypothetical protein